MTKKSELKAKVKGADAEQKIVKKIKDGNSKKASSDKDKQSYKKNKENREFDAAKVVKEGENGGSGALGKRTYADKNGKPKAGEGKKGT